MDRETNFRDDDGNVEAQTSQKSDFSNKNEEQDAKTMCDRENNFNTKD